MFSNKRFLSAVAGVILMALPASALAADHHWDHWNHHHWVRSHNPGYVTPRPPIYATPPIVYGNPPVRYATPPLAYATPYAGSYASPYAASNNLSYLTAKRQQAYNAIIAANRTGNKAGAHRMWELYNGYNQRIASLGGSALPY